MQKMISLCLLGMTILFVGVDASGDAIFTRDLKGSAVVEQVVNVIQSECIFEDDRLFLRRMAYVESADGTKSAPQGYNGGIWRVDESQFRSTQTLTALSYLSVEVNAIRSSALLGNINWQSVTWQDLHIPLYSGLAARLFLVLKSQRAKIPSEIDDQADYWIKQFRKSGDKDLFKKQAKKLENKCKGRQVDLVFVLDGSGSIGSYNFRQMKDFLKNIFPMFDIGFGMTRVGVIQFSSRVYNEFSLNSYGTQQQVINAVEKVSYRGGGTNTAAALKYLCENALTPSQGARNGIPKVAVVLTDGASNSQSQTNKEASLCHDADVTMVAIGVGSSLNNAELKAIASDPDCKHLYYLARFTDFNGMASNIRKRSCDAPYVIEPENGGTINTTLPPGQDWNCRVKLPEDVATVKITARTGTVTYYVAKDTYPNEAYYEVKAHANTGETAVLYVTRPNDTDSIYCNVDGDEDKETSVEMDVNPGGPNCKENSPCTSQNIAAGRFYHAHTNPDMFIQCNEWGQCFEMHCAATLVWDPSINNCNNPVT